MQKIKPALRGILYDMSRKEIFIVIEGGEGSGKTSVLEHLKGLFSDAVHTREPGGSGYAEELRSLVLQSQYAKNADGLTQLLLMYAARRDHLNHTIIPALEMGKRVISDRFAASSWAYNICGQEQRHLEEFFNTLHIQVVGKWDPDAYIFLDVPVEVGIARRKSAGGEDHFDQRKLDFHQRVYNGYKEFLAGQTHRCVDATQSLEKVKADVEDLIRGMGI